MFSIFLAALTTFFAIRKTQDRNITLIATTSFAALYWVTQALAIVYPGTAFVDPEFDTPRAYLLGLPAQATIDILALSFIAVATYMAAHRSSVWTKTPAPSVNALHTEHHEHAKTEVGPP